MKKRDWFFIIFNVWLILDVLVSILCGNASTWDYIELALIGLFLIILAGNWVCKEIEIHKKVRDIRQKRKEQERMEAQEHSRLDDA